MFNDWPCWPQPSPSFWLVSACTAIQTWARPPGRCSYTGRGVFWPSVTTFAQFVSTPHILRWTQIHFIVDSVYNWAASSVHTIAPNRPLLLVTAHLDPTLLKLKTSLPYPVPSHNMIKFIFSWHIARAAVSFATFEGSKDSSQYDSSKLFRSNFQTCTFWPPFAWIG